MISERTAINGYVIGRAMAAMFYAEPIATYDMDVFTELPTQASGLITLAPLYQPLKGKGYEA